MQYYILNQKIHNCSLYNLNVTYRGQMDFIDFDSFSETDNLPQPQPALALPLSTNIETLGKKISNFNSLTRNLLKFEEKKGEPLNETNVEDQKLAEKYANLSINLLGEEVKSSDVNKEIEVSDNKVNASSVRLARVLNSSLSDAQLRQIFSGLEDKYPDSLSMETLVDPGMFGSIGRKRLKSRIEHELIKNQTMILKEYHGVISHLKQLDQSLTKLNEIHNSTNQLVNRNFDQYDSLNSKISELTKKKNSINLKKNLLTSFKNMFTLNEFEEYVLTNGEINDEFFKVLVKADEINDKCSILLSIDNPQLGLKIMSKTNALINKAIDRIISFTNKTLGNLYSLNTQARVMTLHKCLKYLRNKLNYFNTIVNNFTEARSKYLTDELLSQLNGESSSQSNNAWSSSLSFEQSSRPLLVSAHDPLRYIGDLLAYVHSIIVNETETVKTIFTIENDEIQIGDKSNKDIVEDVSDQILSSLARPIRSKIEQLIAMESKLTVIYSIFNLVDLYSIMYSKQLKPGSTLLVTIKSLVKACQEKIITVIKNKLASIKSSNQAQLDINLDLQPPEWIVDFFGEILPIIDQVSTPQIFNFSKEQNDEFLRLVVNEPITIFQKHVSDSKLFTNKKDRLTIEINFLDLVLSKIMAISFLSDKVLEVNEMIGNITNKISELQFNEILKATDIYDLYNVVNMISPIYEEDEEFEVFIYEPIVENKLFNTSHISEINENIKEYLPNALINMQDSLTKLNSPIIVNDIVSNTCSKYVSFYGKFNMIVNEYLKEQLIWSETEVATLLGVDN